MSASGFPAAELRRLFRIQEELVDLRPLGRGHIHDTLLGTYGSPAAPLRYVHQRLNPTVFADLDALMANVGRVTAHLGARTADARHAVRLHPAADGRPMARDSAGATWRTLHFIDGSRSQPRFSGSAQAWKAAATAAGLVADLADLRPPVPEVIPGFHDVVARLGHLEDAAADDAAGRAAGCTPEVDAVLGHGGVARRVAEARADGRLPERTVHNDAKTENLLFDRDTGEPLCLVDLDTVGPGTVLFDVGDLVRSGATSVAEDGGPDTVAVDGDVVAAILGGYAGAGAGFLLPSEVELLPLAGPLMALEAAARFLTDHLRGDVYFRVDGPGHNLRRARNQLRILDLLLAG